MIIKRLTPRQRLLNDQVSICKKTFRFGKDLQETLGSTVDVEVHEEEGIVKKIVFTKGNSDSYRLTDGKVWLKINNVDKGKYTANIDEGQVIVEL